MKKKNPKELWKTLKSICPSLDKANNSKVFIKKDGIILFYLTSKKNCQRHPANFLAEQPESVTEGLYATYAMNYWPFFKEYN